MFILTLLVYARTVSGYINTMFANTRCPKKAWINRTKLLIENGQFDYSCCHLSTVTSLFYCEIRNSPPVETDCERWSDIWMLELIIAINLNPRVLIQPWTGHLDNLLGSVSTYWHGRAE